MADDECFLAAAAAVDSPAVDRNDVGSICAL